MFGTVARMRVLPGGDVALQAWMRALTVPIDGHVSSTVYRDRESPDVFWLAVVFRDEAAYRRNADSPEQHRRWQLLRSALAEDPQWHDGSVIFHGGFEGSAGAP